MSSTDAPQLRTSERLRPSASSTPSQTPQPAPQIVTMPEPTSSTTVHYTAEDILGGDSELSDAPDSAGSGDEQSSPVKRAPSEEGEEGKVPSPRRRRSPSPRKGVGASSSGEGVIRNPRVIISDDEQPTRTLAAEAEGDESDAEQLRKPPRRSSPKDRNLVPKRPTKAPRRPSAEERSDAEPPREPPTRKIKVVTKDAKPPPAAEGRSLKIKIKTGSARPSATPTPTADEFAVNPSETTTAKRAHSRLKAPTIARPEGEETTEGKRKPERREDDGPRRSRDDKSATGKKRPRSDDEMSDHRDRDRERQTGKKPARGRDRAAGSDAEGSSEERRRRSKAQEDGDDHQRDRKSGKKRRKDRHHSSDDELSEPRPAGRTAKKERSSDAEDGRERQATKRRKGVRTDGEHEEPIASDREARQKKNRSRDRPHESDETSTTKKRIVTYSADARKAGKSKHAGTDDDFFDKHVVERGGKTPKTPKTPKSPGYEGREDRGEKGRRREEGDADVLEGKAEGKRKAVDDEGKVRVRRVDDDAGRDRESKNDAQDLPKKKKNRPPPTGDADLPSSDVEIPAKKKKPIAEKPKRDDVELIEQPVRPKLQKRPGERRVAELGGGGTRTPAEGKPRTPVHKDGQEVTPIPRRPVPPKKVAYDPLAAAMSSLGAGGAGPSSGASTPINRKPVLKTDLPAIDMAEARKKCHKKRLQTYAEQVQLNSMSSGLLIQEYEERPKPWRTHAKIPRDDVTGKHAEATIQAILAMRDSGFFKPPKEENGLGAQYRRE